MSKFRIAFAGVALILSTLSSGSLAKPPMPAYELNANGEIEIGPDGKVRNYTLDGKLSAEIAQVVDRRVRAWTFEPIVVDGKAVIAKTRLRLVLLATPVDDEHYALQVENAWFGEPESGSTMTPPRYPREAVMAGIGAKVVLAIRTDAQGRVTDVMAEQTSLSARGRPKVEEKWRNVFEKASMNAARSWMFRSSEELDGKLTSSVIRVPVSFSLTMSPGTGGKNAWRGYVPGPVRPIPWVQDDTVASQSDRDALQDGVAQSLSSRFRLHDDVIGKVL